jgi:hypothetical protein
MTRQISVLLASGAVLGLAGLLPHPADAGLLGAGRTVQVFYKSDGLPSPEGEIAVGASTSDPASLAASVSYLQGANDGVTIAITDTEIIITNQLSSASPFCGTTGIVGIGTTCPDAFDGFDFKFTGESILGVSAAGSSAPGFLPVTGLFPSGKTHNGLQLLSDNEILLDVTGDAPNVSDQLILDLTFPNSTPPTSTPTSELPEPGSLATLGPALAGILAVRRRKAAG